MILSFVLFTQTTNGPLFNHPTKIFFKRDRSPATCSHVAEASMLPAGVELAILEFVSNSNQPAHTEARPLAEIL
jgi:hypothetical protein